MWAPTKVVSEDKVSQEAAVQSSEGTLWQYLVTPQLVCLYKATIIIISFTI